MELIGSLRNPRSAENMERHLRSFRVPMLEEANVVFADRSSPSQPVQTGGSSSSTAGAAVVTRLPPPEPGTGDPGRPRPPIEEITDDEEEGPPVQTAPGRGEQTARRNASEEADEVANPEADWSPAEVSAGPKKSILAKRHKAKQNIHRYVSKQHDAQCSWTDGLRLAI